MASLWIGYALFHEAGERFSEARSAFRAATRIPFESADELASIWIAFIKMELRLGNGRGALTVCRAALSVPPPGVVHDYEMLPEPTRVCKNKQIWTLYADLEKKFGTDATRMAMVRHLRKLGMAGPQHFIKEAIAFAKDLDYERAFKAHEIAISLSKAPEVLGLWMELLTGFVQRFGKSKPEETRSLFERILERIPAEMTKDVFLLYARFEEDQGQPQVAMEVFRMAELSVPVEDRKDVFELHISRAADLFGLEEVRRICENAVKELPAKDAITLSTKFARPECESADDVRAIPLLKRRCRLLGSLRHRQQG